MQPHIVILPHAPPNTTTRDARLIGPAPKIAQRSLTTKYVRRRSDRSISYLHLRGCGMDAVILSRCFGTGLRIGLPRHLGGQERLIGSLAPPLRPKSTFNPDPL